MNAVFAADANFQTEETPEDLRELLTDFEKEFLARNITTLRAAYQRRRQ